jgi:hypothetical protein
MKKVEQILHEDQSAFEVPFRAADSSHDRMKVIAVAVQIEAIVSASIARLLGLKAAKETKSFGHTNSALSFNAKINLFLDVDGISKEHATLLTTFSEIRNKFAHVSEIETIYDCLEATGDKLRNFLEKRYRLSVPDYQYNIKGVYNLFLVFLDDVEKACSAVANVMFNKIFEDTDEMIKRKRHQVLIDVLCDKDAYSNEEFAAIRKALSYYKKKMAEHDFEADFLALI